MGLIITVRGTSGSGKTELVRQVMTTLARGFEEEVAWVVQPGRSQPLGYRLAPPALSRPLFVLGHYERRSGGCDTFSEADGGTDRIFDLAEIWAAHGHAVLLEGATLSLEKERFLDLTSRHDLRVLRLTTPLEQCARNLTRRRRQHQDSWPALMPALTAQNAGVLEACRGLQGHARVLDVSAELGLICICNWLLRSSVLLEHSAVVLPFPMRQRDKVRHARG